MVTDITDNDFEQRVIKSNLPVLLDFWAPWCVPCKMVAPIVDKLSHKYDGRMKFFKINIDDNPRTPSRFQVMSIPSLMIFKNGQVVETVVGAVPERSLISRIDGVL
ncbi:MAG: thioredoxin [Chloroflexi bacterium RBG_13_46_9]|nr:MAG: thioredoxin [Chloroflexi bacterium RBG_13_46_9]